MLRIHAVVVGMVGMVRPYLAAIERRDSDLARQLRRAAASVVLNLNEGMYSRGKNRQARYHSALGSLRETKACLEVAWAFGYVGALDAKLDDAIEHATGTLVRLVER